jgi:cell division septation protein DedD
MSKNEDGEFELVVGNKQLLSIVFILMVLFGVVFAMGYFVGRANVGGDTATAAPPAAGGQGRPDAAGPQAASSRSTGDSGLQPGEAKVAPPEAGSETPSMVSTTPVASEVPAAQTAAIPLSAPVEQTKAPVAPVKQPEPPRTTASAEGPPAGETFLQVQALRKPQAQLLVDVLKERGFRAIMSPVKVDGQELYRALVGPVHGASDLAKTKADLESEGFKPIVKKF